MTEMSCILRIGAIAWVSVLVAACDGRPAGEEPPLHWILHDRNATSESIHFRVSMPSAHTPTGFDRFHQERREPGIGALTHTATLRELPQHLRFHWTVGASEGTGAGTIKHWRFNDIYPYELIPPDVIRRSRGYGYRPPPLLIRFTFLPEGRLRFSWHACADASCKERGDPALRFNAQHDFQGYEVAEPPVTSGFEK